MLAASLLVKMLIVMFCMTGEDNRKMAVALAFQSGSNNCNSEASMEERGRVHNVNDLSGG